MNQIAGNTGNGIIIIQALAPTSQPTSQPSNMPSSQPIGKPSSQPSSQPTCQPLNLPTSQPSRQPTSYPSKQPIGIPTSQPSNHPTSQPSDQPLGRPTSQPTGKPSQQPSSRPSQQPNSKPSTQPSTQPTGQPTMVPTLTPLYKQFVYTGYYQTYTVPQYINELLITCAGAAGGESGIIIGGQGGIITVRLDVYPGQKLYIYVGGNPIKCVTGYIVYVGGYNGGGATVPSDYCQAGMIQLSISIR